MEHIKNSYLKFIRDRFRILYEHNVEKSQPPEQLITKTDFI
jgi:hypothetical protein